MAKKSSTSKKQTTDTLTRKEVRGIVLEIINFASDKTQAAITSATGLENDSVRLTRDQAAYLCNVTEQSIKDSVFAILASKRL
tara:strand:+ start:410 stop:658 length:249 start_codon:yes stop_codon:yes gene_type:complete